ncbi:MAG: hypothetical protein L6V35_05015 [Alistipes putredinis]|nr:MAG: hypothetical protein L6V35_05015 [Alistipes putredinis]
MKVRSRKDTSGVKKNKILDNFSFSGSYNFLADSINLSDISLNLRTTIYGNFGLNISATLDMYQVDSRGRKNKQVQHRARQVRPHRTHRMVVRLYVQLEEIRPAGSERHKQPEFHRSLRQSVQHRIPDGSGTEAADDGEHILRFQHPVESGIQLLA